MSAAPPARALTLTGVLTLTAALAACGSPAASHPATPRPAMAAAATPAARASTPAAAGRNRFSAPTVVSNPMFPLVPGTEFSYTGTLAEGGRARPHTVMFTVSSLTKVIHGVRTVIAWDRDFLDGRLQEQELAFFAQDDAGNVWNFGEYPEEYEHGKFTGAPSTWIRGTGHAYGGIHMLARPVPGVSYREGLVPPIEFDDISTVSRTGQVTCLRQRCYHDVLVVDETSPNDPASGHQIKYYSPGVGLIRVGARGGDSRELLILAGVRHLGPSAMASVSQQITAMDRRAFAISKVYRVTGAAVQNG
jgi:hypothetical protein